MAHHHTPEKLENHLAMTQEEYDHHKSDVYKTTVILSIITIVEVAFALFYEAYLIPKDWPVAPLKVSLVVMSLLKAYWIMFVFMHVKHENKGMKLSIFLPFTLLIWMIISFIWEGSYWNKSHTSQRFVKETKTEAPAKVHH
ncbi:MAG: cytochrome C oxidase subunit IV family protein [Chitinophagales bacterium]|jgi:FtsH-binding integral membrane protein|nr:cytochrome C oxidase subunit IV family protein [Chitinophagales bacterium]